MSKTFFQLAAPLAALSLISCGGDSSPVGQMESPSVSSPAVPAAVSQGAVKGETSPELPPGPPAAAATVQKVAAASNYANERFEPTTKPGAPYRLERVFVEAVMMVEGVPTFDQGMGLKASQTPLARYTFNYYRTSDDTLAFSVEATVLRDDISQSIFSGVGIWYDEDQNPTAKGTFEAGKLHGEYQEFDDEGEVVSTVLYDKGESFEPTRFADAVHAPLLGTWVADSTKGATVRRLINTYSANGLVEIQSITLSKNVILGGKDGLREQSRSKPVTWSFKYTARDDKSGDAEYFDGRTLKGRSRLTFTGPDTMEARTTFHESPSMVGNRYSFTRRK